MIGGNKDGVAALNVVAPHYHSMCEPANFLSTIDLYSIVTRRICMIIGHVEN